MQWLEDFLLSYPGTVFFVTHDRMFMSRLATRIIELDRGRIFSWSCDYKTFLERKQAALDVEEARQGHFDKKLAEEEVWIRQGVKARRCRNEGRVKALEHLREEKRAQRKAVGQVRMHVQDADPSGHRVIKVSHLGFGYDARLMIRDLTTQVMRGDRIGVIGPNGSGKTTLLRLLLGKMQPGTGKVTLGTNVQVAYYDQLREELDDEKTVAQNICGDADSVVINGKARHIIGYLQDFLFTPDRARTPVKVLSGGERNRLFLARLFTRPFNVLVMDEPTNDLDIETLELLEELLLDFTGTLLLVSHDRVFLNNVVTSTMVFEGDGVINEYPGGYDDWLAQRKAPPETLTVRAKPKESPLPKKNAAPRKLSFNERRELDALPAKIAKLEAEQKELYALLADFAFYQKDPEEVERVRTRSAALSEEIPKAYERWEYLEGLAG
jgi:ATP-binding cassette subfamily F protein uup